MRLEVTPDENGRFVLAPGQTTLVCVLPGPDRGPLTSALLNLEVGQRVGVAGFWVEREEAGKTRRYIHDLTYVDPLD